MMGLGAGSQETPRLNSSSLAPGGLGPGGRIATGFLSVPEPDRSISVTLIVRLGIEALLGDSGTPGSTVLGGILLSPMDHAPAMLSNEDTPANLMTGKYKQYYGVSTF